MGTDGILKVSVFSANRSSTGKKEFCRNSNRGRIVRALKSQVKRSEAVIVAYRKRNAHLNTSVNSLFVTGFDKIMHDAFTVNITKLASLRSNHRLIPFIAFCKSNLQGSVILSIFCKNITVYNRKHFCRINRIIFNRNVKSRVTVIIAKFSVRTFDDKETDQISLIYASRNVKCRISVLINGINISFCLENFFCFIISSLHDKFLDRSRLHRYSSTARKTNTNCKNQGCF